MKKIMVITSMVCIFATSVWAQRGMHGRNNRQNIVDLATPRPLPIPPVLEGIQNGNTKTFNMEARHTQHDFLGTGQKTDMLGYNGASYLGPTMRVKRGDRMILNAKNSLKGMPTTLHRHGAALDAKDDGNQNQSIPAGETWKSDIIVKQEAATLWYHPHAHGETAKQAYMGLAGFFIIDDDNPLTKSLPITYGVDDIPIVFQGKDITEDGQVSFRLKGMAGLVGDTLVVNGAVNTYFDTKSKLLRLRLLNGANSGVYTILFGDIPAKLIAGDLGYHQTPIDTRQVTLASGERAEVVLDLSKFQGQEITILAHESIRDTTHELVKLKINDTTDLGTSIPPRLVEPRKALVISDDAPRRFFSLRSSMHDFYINDEQYKHGTINFRVTKPEEVEVWTFKNTDKRYPHPMHLHGTEFYVLSINGRPAPKEIRNVPKDTVLVNPQDVVEIAVVYKGVGAFPYHCHILEHEEQGMMGMMEVAPA